MTLEHDKNRLIYGFSAPLLILVGVASLIVMTDSGASAEGFAAIIILVMIIVAVPLTVVINVIAVPVAAPKKSDYFWRGMVLPAITIVAMLVYYTGIWDDYIDPLLPSTVDKIRTASSARIADNVYESFYVVTAYEGTSEEHEVIDQYMRDHFQRRLWESSSYGTLDMTHYFVPEGRYDPIDDAVSRKAAIVIYRHALGEEGPKLERILPTEVEPL